MLHRYAGRAVPGKKQAARTECRIGKCKVRPGHPSVRDLSAAFALPTTCRARTQCSGFFFLVAEGSWILRCRCKASCAAPGPPHPRAAGLREPALPSLPACPQHQGVEHDPADRSCSKGGCGCVLFDSPWVCNCSHPWARHTQRIRTKTVMRLAPHAAAAAEAAAMAAEINNYDEIRR